MRRTRLPPLMPGFGPQDPAPDPDSPTPNVRAVTRPQSTSPADIINTRARLAPQRQILLHREQLHSMGPTRQWLLAHAAHEHRVYVWRHASGQGQWPALNYQQSEGRINKSPAAPCPSLLPPPFPGHQGPPPWWHLRNFSASSPPRGVGGGMGNASGREEDVAAVDVDGADVEDGGGDSSVRSSERGFPPYGSGGGWSPALWLPSSVPPLPRRRLPCLRPGCAGRSSFRKCPCRFSPAQAQPRKTLTKRLH